MSPLHARVAKLEERVEIDFLERIRHLERLAEINDYHAGYKRGYEDGKREGMGLKREPVQHG